MSASEIVLGTGPVKVGSDGDALRAALGRALGERLGMPARVVATRSYAELLDHVARGVVQLAWMSPALGLRAVDGHGATALASCVRAPGSDFYGVIFVRAASKIRTPEELRGASVAWVDVDSCSGYLFPRLALQKRGLAPTKLFAMERFVASHAAVAHAVATHAVDAGATYYNVSGDEWTGDTVLPGWASVTLEPMRSLLQTDPIPADLLVASPAVEPQTRTHLASVLAALHELPAAAAQMQALIGAQRFDPVDLARYDVVRAAMKG